MKKEDKKAAPLIVQLGIFAAILMVSQLISSLFPADFAVPTPLIGMIILFVLLITHIIKLEQVEMVGDTLIGLIAFLFIPSGIQLAGSLDIIKSEGIQLTIAAVISTICMLLIIAFVGEIVIRIHSWIIKSKNNEE